MDLCGCPVPEAWSLRSEIKVCAGWFSSESQDRWFVPTSLFGLGMVLFSLRLHLIFPRLCLCSSSPVSLQAPVPLGYYCCSVIHVHVCSCLTLCHPWTSACQASLSFTISWSLLKFMSFELVMQSKCLILCCPLLPCPQSFPASGSFPVGQPFPSTGQSIRASASVLPMNIQGWFPLRLTGLISCCPRDSQESSPIP